MESIRHHRLLETFLHQKPSDPIVPIDPTAYPAQIAQLQSIGQLSANIPNTTVNPHNPDPYSKQWQFGLQQALPFQLVGEVTYIGTRGLNTDLYETINLPGRNTNVAPRPNYGSFVYFTTGDSNKYHSLQSSLSRRLDHGVLVQASYTWSMMSNSDDTNYDPPKLTFSNRCATNRSVKPPITSRYLQLGAAVAS